MYTMMHMWEILRVQAFAAMSDEHDNSKADFCVNRHYLYFLTQEELGHALRKYVCITCVDLTCVKRAWILFLRLKAIFMC